MAELILNVVVYESNPFIESNPCCCCLPLERGGGALSVPQAQQDLGLVPRRGQGDYLDANVRINLTVFLWYLVKCELCTLEQ